VRGVNGHVVEAELRLDAGCDPNAVGAAVTVRLCGDWRHSGPCRWPHNNEIAGGRFRTLYVASDAEADDVAGRIETALRGSGSWEVLAVRRRDVAVDERELAARLASGPGGA
jgi:hypothetical protein